MPWIRALSVLLLGLLAAAPLAACASDPPADGRWVELAGETYQVELAVTDEERAVGLMFRDELRHGTGMLFIHAREEPQAYWMMNTLIPLDILYFNSERRLVSQQRNVQPCESGLSCPAYPSGAPALYVLELNAGEAERLGLEDGAELRFGPGIPAAPGL